MKAAACVFARDESHDIQEWIAYHKAIGFDAIIVYDNASADGTSERARRMDRIADVRVVSWPEVSPASEADAYRDCGNRFGGEFDWIAFLSAREFLAGPHGERVAALLARQASASAIGLNWAIFGSNGHVETPSGLVIEAFDRRAPDNFGPNQHVKMIARPTHITGIGNPHYFEFSGPLVTGKGAPVTWLVPGVLSSVDLSGWRVNHYFVRSHKDWQQRIALGHRDVDRSAANFTAYDRNDVRDRAAAGFATPVWSLLDAVSGH